MQRIKEIDIEKAFGIILMIMGHQFYGESFDKFIHGFHMPMFFIISGFLYRSKNDFILFLKRKTQTLIVPYFFFAAFHLLVFFVMRGCSISESLDRLYHIFLFNHEKLPICGAIWFLSSLFFAEIIYYWLDKLNCWLKTIDVICLASLGFVLSCYSIRLPYCIDISLVGIGLLWIGENLNKLFLKKESLRNNSGKIWMGFLGAFVASFFIFENTGVNLRLATYGLPLLFLINATLMTISLFFIASIFSKDNFIVQELTFIGQNSIVYLGLNQFVLMFLKKINLDDDVYDFICKLILLIFCLFILHLFACGLSKTRLKKFIGK